MRLRRPYRPLVVLIVKENSGRKLRWAGSTNSAPLSALDTQRFVPIESFWRRRARRGLPRKR